MPSSVWVGGHADVGAFEVAAPETGVAALIVVFAALRVAGSIPVAKDLLNWGKNGG